jgi:hypothetical protein
VTSLSLVFSPTQQIKHFINSNFNLIQNIDFKTQALRNLWAWHWVLIQRAQSLIPSQIFLLRDQKFHHLCQRKHSENEKNTLPLPVRSPCQAVIPSANYHSQDHSSIRIHLVCPQLRNKFCAIAWINRCQKDRTATSGDTRTYILKHTPSIRLIYYTWRVEIRDIKLVGLKSLTFVYMSTRKDKFAWTYFNSTPIDTFSKWSAILYKQPYLTSGTFRSFFLEWACISFSHEQMTAVCTSVYFFDQRINLIYRHTIKI